MKTEELQDNEQAPRAETRNIVLKKEKDREDELSSHAHDDYQERHSSANRGAPRRDIIDLSMDSGDEAPAAPIHASNTRGKIAATLHGSLHMSHRDLQFLSRPKKISPRA